LAAFFGCADGWAAFASQADIKSCAARFEIAAFDPQATPPFSSVGLRDYYTRCWLQEEAMRRREFITLFGGAAVAWPLTAGAQQPKKMRRIGILWHGANAEQEAIYLAALRQGLRDFGYVEGHNIVLEMRFPAEQYQQFFVLAAELSQQNVDVLVCATAIAAVACHRATTTIPIVGVNVADPVGRKLVASLSQPGGNLTGLSNIAVELTGKRIELAKEMIKDLSRVALLVNTADEIGSRAYIDAADAAGARIGVAVVPVGVRDANDLEGAISKVSADNFQATVVTHDGLFYVQRKRLADLALEKRLPTIAFASEQWQDGVLATYGPNVPTLYRRAGAYIDKIVKGANPADLPVEQPTKFELLINLKTAKAIGVTIPPTVLTRADDVIDS
jgi:putative tryptophan/tyrosine transport system substrate-binding protein